MLIATVWDNGIPGNAGRTGKIKQSVDIRDRVVYLIIVQNQLSIMMLLIVNSFIVKKLVV